MTNGTMAPSTIHGDSFEYPSYGGVPLQIAIPYLLSPPSYTDLPHYWTWRRDVALAATVHREDMWAAAVSKVATKFASHGYVIRDADDSTRKVSASQALFKRANGGEGWVPMAEKTIQDLATTDNGIFWRVRHADDEVQTIKLKERFTYQQQTFDEAQVTNSSRASKITGLYHLDSLRCMRTGNLTYPVRYQPVMGPPQLLRWDQVLVYADMPSPRAELYGVGFCAASRTYKTIAKLAAIEQMIYEFVAGTGATQIALINGLSPSTLEGIIKAGEADAQARGLVYYLGTILGALQGDAQVNVSTILLKQLPSGFLPKDERDNAYIIYANNLGVPVQDIQPLSGQGLGTGTQSIVLAEAAQGNGMLPAFLKWLEQTVSDRILPATTELEFIDENDLRDQKAKAEVRSMRATERSTRIQSGEISAAVARQLAADDGDLPQELLAQDVTPGGQISDDEKPQAQATTNPAALALIASEPTQPQAALASVGKSYNKNWTPQLNALVNGGVITTEQADHEMGIEAKSYDALYAAELAIARSLARWAE